jgi:hypothetical protein
MTTTRTALDRLTIAGLAMVAVLPFLAISPAKAAPACATEAAAVRSIAATADPKAAAKALRNVRTAELICAEGNAAEARRKLAVARQQLDASVQLADRR